jgi:hypothetical protein
MSMLSPDRRKHSESQWQSRARVARAARCADEGVGGGAAVKLSQVREVVKALKAVNTAKSHHRLASAMTDRQCAHSSDSYHSNRQRPYQGASIDGSVTRFVAAKKCSRRIEPIVRSPTRPNVTYRMPFVDPFLNCESALIIRLVAVVIDRSGHRRGCMQPQLRETGDQRRALRREAPYVALRTLADRLSRNVANDDPTRTNARHCSSSSQGRLRRKSANEAAASQGGVMGGVLNPQRTAFHENALIFQANNKVLAWSQYRF